MFWWSASTRALLLVCGLGALASALVVVDRLTTPALAVCWIAYLSVVGVGQEFLSFQWDSLLLEAGALAILTSAWPTALAWLYRWLLFRLMFMSGIVKLMSGDVAWRNLTALTYHFETQPLPNPISWYVHQLPAAVLHGMTAGTLVVETLVPFMYFGPRRVQAIGAGITVAFQCLIFLTGNYTFFNVLTMALALWLLDDDDGARSPPAALCGTRTADSPRPAVRVAPLARTSRRRDSRVRERRDVLGGARRRAAVEHRRRGSRSRAVATLERLRPVRGDDYDAT